MDGILCELLGIDCASGGKGTLLEDTVAVQLAALTAVVKIYIAGPGDET